MAKYNRVVAKPGPVSPLVSTATPAAKTFNGNAGAFPSLMTELFKLGVNLFAGGEKTFYENGKVRDKRFTDLVEKLAVTDANWTAAFLIWLRTEANIRTAATIGAAHFVHARLNNKNAVAEDELLSSLGHKGLNRYLIAEVLFRADEPGEFVAYWLANFGKLPKPVKRGIADSVVKLYNEYTVLKYDTASHAIRFSDVLNLTHAKPADIVSGELFKYIIDKRYDNPKLMNNERLTMISANQLLRMDAAKDVKVLLDVDRVKAAGMTWEDVLSLGGSKLDKKKLWETVIPSMGVMALIRNLRNFEEAGISLETRNLVISKLTNEHIIAKSRQFPYRFFAAYKEINSLHYKAALETATDYSTKNIPELDGNTLVLVDCSGSMTGRMSDKSTMTMMEAGAVFGAALAAKNAGRVTLVAFATTSDEVKVKAGESILPLSQRIIKEGNRHGGGTNTTGAVEKFFRSGFHKRVIIITDEQANYNGSSYNYYSYGYGRTSSRPLGDLCPKDVWMYSFNLAGYKIAQMETGTNRRYQLGGLTDNTFKLIPMMENMGNGCWPWEV